MKNYQFIFSSLWMTCFLWSCSEFSTTIGEDSIQYLNLDQGITLEEEGIQGEQENTSQLPKPEVSHLNSASTLSESEVHGLIKEAILLKLNGKQNATNNQLAVAKFLQAAQSKHGVILAAYHLGRICAERKDIDLAVRWYTLSFQNKWFQDPEQAYASLAYDQLEKLDQQNIFLFHPKLSLISAKSPYENYCLAEKFSRYTYLMEFYQQKTVEPYLDSAENQAKINKIKHEIAALFSTNPQLKECLQLNGKRLQKAEGYMKDSPEKAELFLKQLQPFPDAFHNLGVLYEEGYKNDKIDDEQIANLYKLGGTPHSFFSLGRLFQFKKLPDLEKASYYFKLSGTPDALCSLGIICGQRKDYQQAQDYLKKSGNGRAHHYFALLYCQSFKGSQISPADYILAKEHLDLAIAKGYLGRSYNTLACLFYYGYLDKERKPNYKLAVEYLQKIIALPDCDTNDLDLKGNTEKQGAYYFLGIGCIEGKWLAKGRKPNFKQAKKYFEIAGFSNAYYSLGSLYETGCIYGIGFKKSEEKLIDYQSAIEYYYKSGLVGALLRILHLYQSELVPSAPKKTQELIKQINTKLPHLTNVERYYMQGVLNYYLGNWENAYISLQQALSLNTREDVQALKNLKRENDMVNEILKYFDEQSAVKSVKDDQTTKLETAVVLSAPSIIARPLEKQDQEQSALESAEAEQCSKSETNLEIQVPTISENLLEKKDKEGEKQQITYLLEELKPKIATEAYKLTKCQKQVLKRQERKLVGNLYNPLSHTQPIAIPTEFEFLTTKRQEEFARFQKENNKIQEILNDFKNSESVWSTTGVGKPEVLKRTFRGYKGCLSRRINNEDRLVYKVTGPGKILFLSWEGHYDD